MRSFAIEEPGSPVRALYATLDDNKEEEEEGMGDHYDDHNYEEVLGTAVKSS